VPPSGMCGSVFKGGGRQVSMADMGGRGSRPGELHRRRVVLLAESAGLAAVLNHLLDPADRLSRIGSLRELAESRAVDSADVIVLDVPVEDRADAFAEVRRRFLGPVVVLVARGDKGGGLHLDDAATLLTRPFSTEELGAALAVPGRPASPSPWFDTLAAPSIGAGPSAAASTGVGTPAPPAGAGAVDVKAAARQAPVRRAAAAPPGQLDLIERVQRLLITLTQGWQARRRVRVAGFSAFALVAFTVAFALASQGGCGPGCDAFGTGFSPAPTIAPAESRAPSTTGPKRSTTTTAGSLGTSAARGISDGRLATTSTARRATTTTVKSTGGSSGTTTSTRPPTTLPPTTQAPTTVPTTQPPTTTAPPVN
jgi:DNA-binding response OmpR family regulator